MENSNVMEKKGSSDNNYSREQNDKNAKIIIKNSQLVVMMETI
jgi:hypothetical protein